MRGGGGGVRGAPDLSNAVLRQVSSAQQIQAPCGSSGRLKNGPGLPAV